MSNLRFLALCHQTLKSQIRILSQHLSPSSFPLTAPLLPVFRHDSKLRRRGSRDTAGACKHGSRARQQEEKRPLRRPGAVGARSPVGSSSNMERLSAFAVTVCLLAVLLTRVGCSSVGLRRVTRAEVSPTVRSAAGQRVTRGCSKAAS